MSNGFAPPSRADYATDAAWRQALQTYGVMVGQTEHSAPLTYTGLDDATAYSVTIQNQGTGGHLNVPNLFHVDDSGATASSLVVSGTLSAGATTVTDLTFSGNLLSTGLGKSFSADFSNGTLANRFVFKTSTANSATAVGIVPAGSGASGILSLFNASNMAATGYLNVQMTSTDARLTVGHVGASYLPLTFYVNAAERARIDTNGRLLVGIATAPTATNDLVHAAGGRTYLSAGSEDSALGLRYVSTGGSFYLGATNSATPDLILRNNAGTQIARLFTGGGLLVGTATALTSTEMLEVSTGGLRVQAGGVVLAGSGNIDGNGGTAGQLRIGAVIAGAASLTGSEVLKAAGAALVTGSLTVNGGISAGASSTITGGLTINTGGFTLSSGSFSTANVNHGFYGATAIAKPTISGSRGGNAALASAISALANLGLATDSTTA